MKWVKYSNNCLIDSTKKALKSSDVENFPESLKICIFRDGYLSENYKSTSITIGTSLLKNKKGEIIESIPSVQIKSKTGFGWYNFSILKHFMQKSSNYYIALPDSPVIIKNKNYVAVVAPSPIIPDEFVPNC